LGLRVTEDSYCRWLSHFFFVQGYDAEDLYQEARIAMWLAPTPELARLCARRRIVEILRKSKRGGRPTALCELTETASPTSGDVVDIVLTRERLREMGRVELSPLERSALSRVVRGEGCSEKQLDNALQRARRKLAA